MKTQPFHPSRPTGARARRLVPWTPSTLSAGLAVLTTVAAAVAADTIHFGSAGTYDTEGNALAVTVSGHYAYVAASSAGLVVFDISNPARPQRVAVADTSGSAGYVAIAGPYAYVADGESGLQILDITDPTAPQWVGAADTSGSARKVVVAGPYAYVADGPGGLQILDVANPLDPRSVAEYKAVGSTYDVAVSGPHAFLAQGSGGFQVLDVSNPADPHLVGSIQTEGFSLFCLTLSGTHAYAGAGRQGMRVIDIADPTAPRRVNQIDQLTGVSWATVTGNYLYVARGAPGLRVLDVSDPVHPVAVGGYDGAVRGLAFAESGDYLYAATGGPTLEIRALSPVAFAEPYYSVLEDAPSIKVAVNRTSASQDAVIRVDYWTEDGTATGGEDYVVGVGELHFEPGESSQFIEIGILNDAITEGLETFSLHLGVLEQGAPVTWFSRTEVSIIDNDPGIHFAQLSYAFREDAGAVDLTVVRGNDFELPPITVDFATRDGSAVAGEDYLAAAGTLSFGEGEERQTLRLQLLDDQVAEPREVFHVSLSNPTGGAQLGQPSTCTVMIEVDDARVTLGVLGEIGGWRAIRLEDAWGIDVAGHYAYVGDGSAGVRIVDISVPSRPREVARHDTEGGAYGVAVRDDHLYVGDGGQLLVLDVSNPGQPQAMGSWQAATNALGVAVADHYVYLADGSAGLQILEVSDPSSPRVVGNYDTPGGAQAVAVQNALAYVADGKEGLQIIDVSDPTQPQGIGAWKTSGSAWGVAVSGQYAYLACTNGLHIVDVSDPADLQGIAKVELTEARDVIIERGYAWVAHAGGLAVIELTDPHLPVQVANASTDYAAWGVALAWPYALVTDWPWPGSGWLYVIDVSTPTDPQRLSGPTSGRSFNDIAVAGDHALVAAGQQGLEVINLADPLSLERVGQCSTPGWAVVGVVHQGDRAYVVDGQGLQVIDVTHPADPRRVGGTDTPGYARAVAVQGDYAYVADGSAGLQVIDVTHPADPRLVGATDTPGSAQSVAVQGDTAYVADGEAGHQIIAITDPTRPQLQGSYRVPDGAAIEVVVTGNLAYLAAGQAGLQVIDVADPAQPRWLSAYELGWVLSVAVWRDYVLVGHSNGLEIIDVRDPAHPVWAGGLESVLVRAITVSGNRVLLATGPYYWDSGEQGLIILRANEVPAFDDIVVGVAEITLRWNSGAEGMVLQRSPSLDPPAWQTVADSANTNRVTLPLEGGSQFFRLLKP